MHDVFVLFFEIIQIHLHYGPGDILVFMTGQMDINAVCALTAERLGNWNFLKTEHKSLFLFVLKLTIFFNQIWNNKFKNFWTNCILSLEDFFVFFMFWREDSNSFSKFSQNFNIKQARVFILLIVELHAQFGWSCVLITSHKNYINWLKTLNKGQQLLGIQGRETPRLCWVKIVCFAYDIVAETDPLPPPDHLSSPDTHPANTSAQSFTFRPLI